MRISKSSKTDVKAAKSDFEYEVQGNYGYGWDRLTTEATMEEAKEQKKCYDENEPDVPHRIKTIAKGSVDACDDVKASTKFKVGDEVYIDKGNLPRVIGIVDSIDGDDIIIRDWRNDQITYHPDISKVHKRDLRASTDTDKALQHIKAAIDILGNSGMKDDITKDSIANLATVMFDIKGRK